MFENSLIDLGLIRQPVLKRFHWAVSVVIGAVFFTTAWFVLGAISDVETGVVNFQATVIGVFTGSWSLMVCYIWTDSRRENFSVLWMGLALFHLAGLWCICSIPQPKPMTGVAPVSPSPISSKD